MSNPKKQPKDTNSSRSYVKYSGLAFQMLAILFIGVWGGYNLDTWAGLKFPVFTIILSLLALFAIMYYLIKRLPRI